jgi:hypothetical protein
MHFDGELRPPTRVTMEDWPVFDEQWRSFLADRKARAKVADPGYKLDPTDTQAAAGVAQ